MLLFEMKSTKLLSNIKGYDWISLSRYAALKLYFKCFLKRWVNPFTTDAIWVMKKISSREDYESNNNKNFHDKANKKKPQAFFTTNSLRQQQSTS